MKRLLAYSAISHTGFILLGFVACSPSSTKALIFYVTVYGLLTILLFAFLIACACWSTIFPKYLVNWTGFGSKNPIFNLGFVLVLFSIAGMPPLAGFFCKFLVLFSLLLKDYFFSATFVIILSTIGCFYYIRLIKIIFFAKPLNAKLWLSSLKRISSETISGFFFIFNALFVVFSGFFSSFSISLCLALF